jgi:uncharacterized membrane protein required for colicin V production
MWFYIFYGIVIFAGLAMTVREGLWSNTLTLISIIISGLVAFGFYSPLVVYLDEEMTNGQHTYWLDFAIIWALYAVTMIIVRTLFASASKTRMRFKHPIDPVGGPIVGFLAAWVLAGFTLATFHTSPMPKDAFSGKLVSKDDVATASILTSPDAAWLRFFVDMTGKNAMGFLDTSKSDSTKKALTGWVGTYEGHRKAFEGASGLIVARTKK